jgi:hypothetical protein
MKRALVILAVAPAVLAAPAWAECYTVVQRNLIVYRAPVTPIDLSGPIHPALQKRFPGGQLVISDDDKGCTYIDPSTPIDPNTGGPPAGPGSERASLSVVASPAESPSAGAAPDSPQPSADVGCRRGGTVTRRGEPCPDTEVVGGRVVGAERAPPAAQPPVPAETGTARRR